MSRRDVAIPSVAVAVDPRRLEPLLAKRIADLTVGVEGGDVDCWAPLCAALVAYSVLHTINSPERQGRPLTTAEMAARLGVGPKSLRRMVKDGRIRPALKVGHTMRWSGREGDNRL
jgi:excisionase family DNA binding protein